MRKLKCDMCEYVAEGDTFESWMQALMPHYMVAHGAAMQAKATMNKEDVQAEKEKWMSDNKTRFDTV